jgi:hypothetical protein
MRWRSGVIVYLVLSLSLGSLCAWQTYNAPIDCTDGEGHGPDPDTRECKMAIVELRNNRLVDATSAFLTVSFWCGGGLAQVAAFRFASNRFSSAWHDGKEA